MTSSCQIKNIIFDADDTLWYDSKYFMILEESLMQCGINSDLNIEDIKVEFSNTLKYEPRGETGFANAVLQTAISLGFAESQITHLKKEVEIFLNHPIELIEEVDEILKNLNLKKVVLTKGNYHEQINKLNKSGLASCFDNIIVVVKKNDLVLKSVLQILDFKSNETVLIGNSIIHDIEPSIMNELKTIWFNHSFNYFGRNAQLTEGVPEITSWKELLNAISRLYEK